MIQTVFIASMSNPNPEPEAVFRAMTDKVGIPVVFNRRIIVRPSEGWWKGIIAPGYAEGQMHPKVFHVAQLVKRAVPEC